MKKLLKFKGNSLGVLGPSSGKEREGKVRPATKLGGFFWKGFSNPLREAPSKALKSVKVR